MDGKDFTIIIPAHNSAGFIEKALSSIRAQEYDRQSYELIVVCDACTDNTKEVAEKYADRVIVTDYGRDGLARQSGIDQAAGNWILFMDDDDWWLHEYVLATLAPFCLIDADIVCFGFIWRKVGNIRQKAGRIFPNVWSKMYRRDFLTRSGVRFDDTRMASDLVFNRKILTELPAMKFIDQPLYYYNYMRPGSQTEVESRES
jgi:glycosyltransferase involved in cell wall biosynthesis